MVSNPLKTRLLVVLVVQLPETTLVLVPEPIRAGVSVSIQDVALGHPNFIC